MYGICFVRASTLMIYMLIHVLQIEDSVCREGSIFILYIYIFDSFQTINMFVKLNIYKYISWYFDTYFWESDRGSYEYDLWICGTCASTSSHTKKHKHPR